MPRRRSGGRCSTGGTVMGIVAFCPRGHRVKVKDELGGRKGICPECQVRFRIPPAGTELPVARVVSLDPVMAERLPRAEVLGSDDLLQAAGGSVQRDDGREAPESDGVGVDALPPDAFEPLAFETVDRDPAAGAAAARSAALHPAIAERPELAWCVAVPGGRAVAAVRRAGAAALARRGLGDGGGSGVAGRLAAVGADPHGVSAIRARRVSPRRRRRTGPRRGARPCARFRVFSPSIPEVIPP